LFVTFLGFEAPVRVTLGAPKFRLDGYTLAGEILELAPSPGIFRLEWLKFESAYLRQLDRVDWQAVDEQLHMIAAAGRRERVRAALLRRRDVGRELPSPARRRMDPARSLRRRARAARRRHPARRARPDGAVLTARP
jgi:hypothetical protein